MSKASPWKLTVLRSERLTPNMQRITFGGTDLDGFPKDAESGYLKIGFPVLHDPRDGLRRRIGRMLGREAKAVRSYTVRRFDPVTRELDVDFVVHEDTGPAASWAVRATPGDALDAGGPGPAKLLNQSGDWYLIVGDMSALPAIGVNLERLDETATGYALIEILDASDRQPLVAPPGIDVRWIVNPDPRRSAELMLDEVRGIEWKAGRCEAWIASELATVRAIRGYLKSERGLTRDLMYASSYWQLGQSDEQHRVAKSKDQAEAATG